MSFLIRLSEPPWQIVNVTSVHTGANPIVIAGTDIWVPPFPCLVRAFTINDDIANPLAGGGTLNVGANTGDGSTNGSLALTRTVALASYGTRLFGWGVEGAGVAIATGVGLSDSGIVFAPAGSVPGRPAMFRHIAAFSSAAAVTGTLRFRFEMRPFAGDWV